MQTQTPQQCNDHQCSDVGFDIVTINQSARLLQEALAEAHPSQEQLDAAEALCLKIHRSTCAILAWAERKKVDNM